MAKAFGTTAAGETAKGQGEGPGTRLVAALASRFVILVPYLWLLFFFLVPFLIVFKISLSHTAIAMPPYTPTLGLGEGLTGLIAGLRELSFENYLWLVEDALYFNAYVSSVVIAAVSTLLTLVLVPVLLAAPSVIRAKRAARRRGDAEWGAPVEARRAAE